MSAKKPPAKPPKDAKGVVVVIGIGRRPPASPKPKGGRGIHG